MPNLENHSHPGKQIFHILTQIHDYLHLYQKFGFDGIVCRTGKEHSPHQVPALETLEDRLQGCQRCKLHTGRTHIVFGTGNPHADLVFVGEGPGYHEDQQGIPFVGKAGALLTRIIEAIGLRRDDVYITNIVKCRPPNNRDPEPDEIASCEPFLLQQLESIQPKIICALGTFAAQALLKTTSPISKLRGRFHEYQGIPLMPTFHPAYLLRNPQQKRLVWQDMQMVQRKYEALIRKTAVDKC
jgi:DNA polymerase